MITKFKTITNLAVFRQFEWDQNVKNADGAILEFKPINIIYGRNYSGKTTLSRIARCLETGQIPPNYTDPEFEIMINGHGVVTPSNLTGHPKTVRVFNEDFVRKNLSFIVDPEQNIEAFAVLGEENAQLEQEIQDLEREIGSDQEGDEFGLLGQLIQAKNESNLKSKNYEQAKSSLMTQLGNKATDRQVGIKYNSEKFGDQNYNRSKLSDEISLVSKPTFSPLSSLEIDGLEKQISEQPKAPIPSFDPPVFQFAQLLSKTNGLLQRVVGQADKIEALVRDAALNRWVKEGKYLHQDKRESCGFCGNTIDPDRWEMLDKHFDEESSRLETDIEYLLRQVDQEKQSVANAFRPKKDAFYSRFHAELDQLIVVYGAAVQQYIAQLEALNAALMMRKENLLSPYSPFEAEDFSEELSRVHSAYCDLCAKSNEATDALSREKGEAQVKLRHNEVWEFVQTIGYDSLVLEINQKKVESEQAEVRRDGIVRAIQEKRELVAAKKRERNDEEKGAQKVNEYLNNVFGHQFLSLQAIQPEGVDEETPTVRFEVHRESQKAYNLSEGERSLVAFCYFVAKLEDTSTQGQNPIIWIDDPISSLDGNHIFYIYSIINSEIVVPGFFEQLFISTHNLDFLKYLKRLPGATVTKETRTKYRFLVLNRNGLESKLELMPGYLREFVTEFNYLFGQLYQCAQLARIDDSNYGVFYNFGNNARKFLEVFLYYKYPDSQRQTDKLSKFFGNDPIPPILVDRISNEYSHLCGVMERGGFPIEVPEMNAAAKLILARIKELDEEQYFSFIRSIGIEP